MLSKAHLTSYSRMSRSRWVTISLWLFGSLRPFLYTSFVYSFYHFLISSASVWSLPFLLLLCPFLHEMFPWYLQFTWRNLLSFPVYSFSLFLCIVHLREPPYLSLLFSGTLHSNGCIFPFVLFLSLLFPSPTLSSNLPCVNKWNHHPLSGLDQNHVICESFISHFLHIQSVSKLYPLHHHTTLGIDPPFAIQPLTPQYGTRTKQLQ